MAPDTIRNFDDLNALYWQNRQCLGEEEQRLFQAILLEMQKGDSRDNAVIERCLRRLGELKNLTS